MRRALFLLLILSLPVSVQAMMVWIPIERAVRESDLIVIGTLRDVAEHSDDEWDYGQGLIEVREVVWGEVSPGDSLLLKWRNASTVLCPRIEHAGSANEEGIWLLTRDGDAVRANNPGHFVKLSERGKVEAALRNSPVVLRSEDYQVGADEPMRFSVVYRNVSNVPRSFPGLAPDGGNIRISHGSRLALNVGLDTVDTHGTARLAGRVVRDAGLAPVNVPPRGEHRVEFDLRAMLTAEPLEKSYYNVTLKFDGLPLTNRIDFYLSEPRALQTAPPPPPVINYSRPYVAPVKQHGLSPFVRAELTALTAFVFFPLFYRLRANLAEERLARVIHGAQRWQI